MTDKTDKTVIKNISTTQPNRKVTPNAGGFSLIEILTVLMIIAILAAIGLTVGGKVMTAASKKKTAAYMQIVMHAITIYHEECGELPYDPTGYPSGYPKYKGQVIPLVLDMLRYGESPAPSTTNPINKELWNSKIKPIIDKLPDKAFATLRMEIKSGQYEDRFCFVDGFDEPLIFDPDGGLGGTPQLISKGRDRNIGTAGSDEEKDNIYSDK